MDNSIIKINKYDSELHEFATLFHQDFDEISDLSNEMVLDYLVRLNSNNKRSDALSRELKVFVKKIESLNTRERLDLWFKHGAQYWNIELDMVRELKKYMRLLRLL